MTDEKVNIILALPCESQFHLMVDLTKMLSFSCGGDILLTAQILKNSLTVNEYFFFFLLAQSLQILKIINNNNKQIMLPKM